MAANFWLSSHCNYWLVDRRTIRESEAANYSVLSAEEVFRFKLFCVRLIQLIGQARQHQIRQQVIATAVVFFKRFYIKNTMLEVDPLLVAPTCLYLACKVEECAQVARTIVEKTKAAIAETPIRDYPYTERDILECELYLLEDLDCYLIIYHPYRPLTQYLQDLKLPHLLQPAWSIVNDSLRTDACLLYPPFLVSLAAIYMTVTIHNDQQEEQDIVAKWFAELNVEMKEVLEVTQDILNAYSAINELEPDTNPIIAEISRRTSARVGLPAPAPVVPSMSTPSNVNTPV